MSTQRQHAGPGQCRHRVLVRGLKLAVGLLMVAGLPCALRANNAWPADAPIRPGQRVLFFGDSIVGPGMYSYVVNALLDELAPGSGVTFHSSGKAMATSQSILPDVERMVTGHPYDWILINFAHNDVGRYDADEFRTVHAPALLGEVRKHHAGRIGWLSILGNEPSPYADEPGRERQTAQCEATRQKQAVYAEAVRQLCADEGLHYVPLFEPMSHILDQRREKQILTAFTMDSVHPNLVGSWIIGGVLYQSLGLPVRPLTVDVLPGDVWCDQSRLNPDPRDEPVSLAFDSLFLTLRLVPPAERVVPAMRLPVPVSLDGDPAEWGDIAPVTIRPPLNVTWELTPRASALGYAAAMRAGHDGETLYMLFEVTTPYTGPGEHFQEIIEVFIDAREDRSRTGNVWRRTPGLTQFVFMRDFTGAEPTSARAAANGDASQGMNLRAAARKTADGYVLEAAIPLANFKHIDLLEDAVPFHWAVSFSDQVINLDWQGLMSRSSSTFGYGRLIVEP